jgi:hypothetical protein
MDLGHPHLIGDHFEQELHRSWYVIQNSKLVMQISELPVAPFPANFLQSL